MGGQCGEGLGISEADYRGARKGRKGGGWRIGSNAVGRGLAGGTEEEVGRGDSAAKPDKGGSVSEKGLL